MSNEIKKDELKNKGVKSNEVKSTDLVLNGEVLKIDRDKILKFSKKMSIEGWTYASGPIYNEKTQQDEYKNDKQFGVQFRSIIEEYDEVKEETIDVLYTMKLNLTMEPEELNKMVGKVYLFDNLDKYRSDDKRTLNFGCPNKPVEIKELEGQEIHELIVETREEVTIRKVFQNARIRRIQKNGKTIEKKQKTPDCILQCRILLENGDGGIFPQLFEVIVRDTQVEEIESLKTKKMKLKNLITYKAGKKVIIETKVKPTDY